MSSLEPNTQTEIPTWQVRTGWGLSCLLLLVFLPSAFFKIAQPAGFLEGWTKSYPASSARPLGLIELLCVVLHFIPRTRIFGTILMTGYLGGAVATHVQKGEPQLVVAVLVGTIAWGALYLRDARLRKLVPLTKD